MTQATSTMTMVPTADLHDAVVLLRLHGEDLGCADALAKYLPDTDSERYVTKATAGRAA